MLASPYLIWHHAIVVEELKNGRIKIIHYSNNPAQENDLPAGMEAEAEGNRRRKKCGECAVTVHEAYMKEDEEQEGGCSPCVGKCCCLCWKKCDILYRVNYKDCYTNEYTVLRARTLENENRYNMIERNCEHFSRWCKTGSDSSSQISVLWTSIGKILVGTGLRLAGLLVLFLMESLFESQEDEVTRLKGNRYVLEIMQKFFLAFYIVVMTVVFTIYLLKSSCSHLTRVIPHDAETVCSDLYRRHQSNACIRCCCSCWCFCFSNAAVDWCCGRCSPNTGNYCPLCCCCLICCCHSIVRRLCCSIWTCRKASDRPWTCFRREGYLACGLTMRIVSREVLSMLGILLVMMLEDPISKTIHIVHWSLSREPLSSWQSLLELSLLATWLVRCLDVG